MNLLFAESDLRGQDEPLKKRAFIAGVSRYLKAGWDNLRYCEKDARDLKAALESLGFEVTALIGPEATKKEVEEQLKQFLLNVNQELGKEDIVLVYFSGHGLQRSMQDNEEKVETPFFCPYDAVQGDFKSLVSLNNVIDLLKQSSSEKNIMLVDCCRSNPEKGAKGPNSIDGSIVRNLPNTISVLFGSSDGQKSWESDLEEVQQGIFTHVFLEGLRGKAANEQGDIEWFQLAGYVLKNVPLEAKRLVRMGQDQRPNLIMNSGPPIILGRVNPTVKRNANLELGGTPTAVPSAAIGRPAAEGPPAASGSSFLTRAIGLSLAGLAAIGLLLWISNGMAGKDRATQAVNAPQQFPIERRGKPESTTSKDIVKAIPLSLSYAEGMGLYSLPAAATLQLPPRENSLGMKLKLLPQGTFVMGTSEAKRTSPDEVAHSVTLTAPFFIGVHPVTQQQYQQVMGTNPSRFKGAEHPVETVSWDDAEKFCQRLTEQSQKRKEIPSNWSYRLPTEAEWEYACRAGSQTQFNFGSDENQLDAHAWYGLNSMGTTHPIGQKRANGWGLFDLLGNVREWCRDWYGKYPTTSLKDPVGADHGSTRVNRGGSFDYNQAACFASAFRDQNEPSTRDFRIGFRVVLKQVRRY